MQSTICGMKDGPLCKARFQGNRSGGRFRGQTSPSLCFDISDTGTREHSRTPWLWQLEERHLDSVQAMLERTYDVSGDDLAGQLTEVAGKLAEEYWTEHQQDFFYIVDGSFWRNMIV